LNRRPAPETLLCCGIFRQELERLGPSILGGARLVFSDSMLHMLPSLLDDRLAELTRVHPEDRRLLVYGDCSPHMAQFAQLPNVVKVAGVNCCEIMLGPAVYRQLRREGVFFLLPEWTKRWEEVFKRRLGFTDPALAREFMHEMHTRFLYLDTGTVAVPRQTLAAIGRHFDMPAEVRRIGLEYLAAAVADGLGSFDCDR